MYETSRGYEQINESRPAGTAALVHIKMREASPLFGQLVDRRGVLAFGSVTTDIPITEVVGEVEQDIRFALGLHGGNSSEKQEMG